MNSEKAKEVETRLAALFKSPGKFVGSMKASTKKGSAMEDVITVTKEWRSPVFGQLYIVSFKTLKGMVSVTVDGPIGDLRVATTSKEGDDLISQLTVELEIEGRVVAPGGYKKVEKVRA